jgi:biofilm protein TabA
MRKIAFVKEDSPARKLMIFVSEDGVYLFGYDCVEDSSCVWDKFFSSVEDAEEFAYEAYHILDEDWISISDPHKDCQQDFILPTRIKRIIEKPLWGKFEVLVNNKWIDADFGKTLNFGAMTGNERLFLSGLMKEFDQSKIINKENAIKILKALRCDEGSINLMVQL